MLQCLHLQLQQLSLGSVGYKEKTKESTQSWEGKLGNLVEVGMRGGEADVTRVLCNTTVNFSKSG